MLRRSYKCVEVTSDDDTASCRNLAHLSITEWLLAVG